MPASEKSCGVSLRRRPHAPLVAVKRERLRGTACVIAQQVLVSEGVAGTSSGRTRYNVRNFSSISEAMTTYDRIQSLAQMASSGIEGATPLTNLTETLFTQCLSLVGVACSPWKTCPRWPPHLAHMISTRCMPRLLSTLMQTESV